MPQFSAAQQRAIQTLASDLEHIFGVRLQSLVVYAGNQADGSLHSCAIVDGLGLSQFNATLTRTAATTGGFTYNSPNIPIDMFASGSITANVIMPDGSPLDTVTFHTAT